MRWTLVWMVASACSSGCDGQSYRANADASILPVDALPSCGTSLAFSAADAYDVVSDGADFYISILQLDGSYQVVMLPGGGGATTTLVTGPEQLPIAAFDNAIFYSLRVGATYEVHQRVGITDTMLGSVSANQPLELAANATDVYGLDSDSTTTLWRFPRSGDPPQPVTTISGPGHGLELGTTVAAFYAGTVVELVSLPGPSQPTEFLPEGYSDMCLAGDSGFWFTVVMQTQNTRWFVISQFTPVKAVVHQIGLYMDSLSGLSSDGGHLYMSHGPELLYWTPSSNTEGRICNPGLPLNHDRTRLFGLTNAVTAWQLHVLSMPP